MVSCVASTFPTAAPCWNQMIWLHLVLEKYHYRNPAAAFCIILKTLVLSGSKISAFNWSCVLKLDESNARSLVGVQFSVFVCTCCRSLHRRNIRDALF